jgi:hypothetical protein
MYTPFQIEIIIKILKAAIFSNDCPNLRSYQPIIPEWKVNLLTHVTLGGTFATCSQMSSPLCRTFSDAVKLRKMATFSEDQLT